MNFCLSKEKNLKTFPLFKKKKEEIEHSTGTWDE
jgi:hypothetical protein